MTPSEPERKTPDHRVNTIAMLGQAYSLLGFRIVDGVVGAGYPQKPKHSAVFAQLGPEGARLTDLARGAGMTPQAMGEVVDELEELGYVRREPDPADRRAKRVMLTPLGIDCVRAAVTTIDGIEADIESVIGADGHARLRELLAALLAG
ncbi:MarR family winged helix-turn-helix transcriptional regulator [Microbacterium sp. ASV49]|uniref:MarR family winged helix-turn-helix transcriptional regulator n=1 Tax=Microbacterium candidum TaxID=3041922 RepID=A0ABT7MUU2_9MICO|nr:MarR family winged helix-turn-helix transcriptional regulator [Microbacterium sp. ASV49]MDL9978193.1 MarR family winged helix-turn-helix transcriptional regulator [Microbacterium sp. ASV49]